MNLYSLSNFSNKAAFSPIILCSSHIEPCILLLSDFSTLKIHSSQLSLLACISHQFKKLGVLCWYPQLYLSEIQTGLSHLRKLRFLVELRVQGAKWPLIASIIHQTAPLDSSARSSFQFSSKRNTFSFPSCCYQRLQYSKTYMLQPSNQ